MPTIQKNTGGRNLAFGPLGLIFIILAVVGLVSVVVYSMRFTGYILTNSKEKAKFEHIILPVLMLDPVTYDSPTVLDNLTLLQASVWSTVLSADRDKYAVDDYNRMLVPATDVDKSCLELFGPEVTLDHGTFTDYTATYTYDTDTNMYQVPMAQQVGAYTPQVDEIRKIGDVLYLKVGYVPPGNLWTMDARGTTYQPKPDKYMMYLLKKAKSYYNIISIKDIDPAIFPPVKSAPGVSSGSSAPQGYASNISASASDSAASGSEAAASEPVAGGAG